MKRVQHKVTIPVRIEAEWHQEEGMWLATSEDIVGLVIEAENLDLLKEELKEVVPVLVALNGINGKLKPKSKDQENVVPFTLVTHASEELSLCM